MVDKKKVSPKKKVSAPKLPVEKEAKSKKPVLILRKDHTNAGMKMKAGDDVTSVKFTPAAVAFMKSFNII